MPLNTVKLGNVEVSRLIIGGNPFSGFSHRSRDDDRRMVRYHTTESIKATLRRAEAAGITAHLSRTDRHVMRYLLEYWDQGGKLKWIAQTCPQVAALTDCISYAIQTGAAACFVHGGMMDYKLAQNDLDDVPKAIEMIRDAGLAAGIAGHNPDVHRWAEANLDVDFYMCSYYNPTSRANRPEHIPDAQEHYSPIDRDRMVETIAGLSKPAIHYKVLAAGRNDPEDAFAFVARHLRPTDAVCVGICLDDNPDSIEENAALLEKHLALVASA